MSAIDGLNPISYSNDLTLKDLKDNLSQKVIKLATEVSVNLKNSTTYTSYDFEMLQNILKNETDINARIASILKIPSSNIEGKWRQLRDITYYLSIVESHLNEDKKSPFHVLIQKINAVVQGQSEKIQPPWLNILLNIQKEIEVSTKLNKDEEPATLLSHLENHCPIPIEASGFAHIHAESYIANTGLEGNVLRSMLKHYLDYSKKVITHPTPALQNLQEQLLGTEKFLTTLETIEKGSDKISTSIKELKANQGLILPSGWAGKPAGHALLLKLQKTENGSFQVFLYNSGEGLNYHPALNVNNQILFQPYVALENVKEDILTSPEFVTALTEMLIIEETDQNILAEYNEKDIYEKFLLALGGNRLPPSDDIHQYIVASAVGICSWGAIQAASLHALSKEEYNQLLYGIKIESLCDYFLLNQESFHKEERERMLMQKSAEQFARDALSFFYEGTINITELQKVHSTLRIMFEALEKAERMSTFEKSKSRLIDLKNLETLPLFRGVELNHINTLDPFTKKSSSITPSVPGLLISTYKKFEGLKDPKHILKTLTDFKQWAQNIKSKDKDILNLSLVPFYNQLPLPSKIDNIWDQLSQETIVECLFEFATLTQISIENTSNNSLPANQLGALKMLLISWHLAKKIPSLNLLTQGELPLKYLLTELIGAQPFGGKPITEKNIYDPNLRVTLSQVFQFVKESLNPHRAWSPADFYAFGTPHSTSAWYSLSYYLPLNSYDSMEKPTEIIYLKEELKKIEIQEKLFELFPAARSESKLTQLGYLLQDLNGLILPKAFCALKKQLFLACELAGEDIKWGNDFKPRINKPKQVTYPYENLRIEMGKNQNVRDLSTPFEYGKGGSQTFANINNPDLLHLLRVSREPKEVYTELYVREETAKWIEEFSFNAEFLEKAQLPINEIKDLLTLMANGDYDGTDPHWEMQPLKTIAYFTKNRLQLQNQPYKALFKLLFFEANYLEILLDKNPTSTQILEEFINKGLQFFADRGDINTQVFLLDQMDLISRIVALKGIPNHFPNVQTKLRDLLAISEITPSEKKIISTQLATSYLPIPSDQLTQNQIVEIVESVCAVSLESGDDIFAFSVDTVLKVHHEPIKSFVQGPDGNSFLNSLVKKFRIDGSQTTIWDRTTQYPICSSTDGINIDLSNGSIYQKGHPTTNISPTLLNSINFKKVFKKNDYTIRKIEYNRYAFNDEFNISSEIMKVNKELQIRKQLNPGKWSNYMDHLPLEWFQKIGTLTLTEGKTLWNQIETDGSSSILFLDQHQVLTHRIQLSKLSGFIGDNKIFEPLRDDLSLKNYIEDPGELPSDEEIIIKILILNLPDSLLTEKMRKIRQKGYAPKRTLVGNTIFL